MRALHDVLIVGLGPTGLLAANLLGALGVRVLGIDRAPRPYGLPRAATTDDEVLRILQNAGLAAEVLARAVVHERVEFVDARGAVHVVQEGAARPQGHPPLVSLSQADLEEVLLRGAARFGCVELRWGEALAGHAGRFVLGCDGAHSAVRARAGIEFRGRSAGRPWLVADVGLRAPVELPGVRFLGDPRRPAVMLPLAPNLHRWEWLLAPGEPAGRDQVARLVAPWLQLDEHDLVRSAMYTYHARSAARWRDGSTFLLGDAAHLMPPFAGQGLGAGMRDAHNLCWKLAAVLGGADPALPRTYEPERRGNVRAYTALALGWGAIVQTRRSRLATARDGVLATLERTPLAPRLRAGTGLRPRSRLIPQPRVRRDGAELLLDDVLGPGPVVLTIAPDARSVDVRGERWEVEGDLLSPWRGRTVSLRSDRVPR